ncbi:RusA family crossover junction endodeoxyribonuclease [Planococcus faecalis]|uniref:Uncharacterized protein n=1 Tax=Planococcus faecalis TaxID=1598147 RepID=A0ABM6IT23_9BACL|nr:RusA family crossover junction endodeoxyribonuclease [Planococcus faecalis]AQU79741.1 hypothetical protein AJGP001_10900 [Planococcus faecalis]OHX52062.1 hypothetical protein BB777_14115 [Planococcus faecalis]
METISFVIHGEAQAQGRPRAGKSFSGKTVLYDPINSRDFKQYVRLVSSQYKPEKLLECPLSLELHFYKQIPASWSNKKKEKAIRGELLPAVKSDIDNYAKSVMDGLSGIIYTDDKLVCELIMTKRYSESPRTEVTIKQANFEEE